jgi:hypothetical protein
MAGPAVSLPGTRRTTVSADVDLLRINIGEMAEGKPVVYDNQMGDDDDAHPMTAIGGGSCVIHKAK